MSWRRFRAIIQRALFLPAQANRDLDDEIRFHLAEETRLQADRGLPADAAAAAARRAFGSVALAKEKTRAVWVFTAFEQFVQDLRFGLRILSKSPAVSITAVALIALVIGGNTTVFSLAHAVLAKPTPGVKGPGLATVSWVGENGEVETHNSYRVYSHFFANSTTVRPMMAVDFARLTLTTENGSFAVRVGIVSANYFETLGVHLVKGRTFTAEEANPSSALVAVAAHHIWQNHLQGADAIVGRSIALNGQPAAIVGVAEAGFRGAWLAELADLWIPVTERVHSRIQPNRSTVDVAMIGRLAEGATLEEAQTELSTLWSQMQRAFPDLHPKVRLRLVPYSATAGGNSIVAMQGNRMLAIFSVVTLLTIAIVCANVTNLLIARAVVRQREIALRQSLGASRLRIVRGLLAEGLVLSAVAWIAACLFAWMVAKLVISFLVPYSPDPMMLPDPTPDWTVVGYALALALLCTIAVTVGPALRMWRTQLLPFLKIGEQGVVQARSRLSRSLVVLQLALSVLLLTSAGLAHRSMSLKDSVDVGFDTSGVLLTTVNTAASGEEAAAHGVLLAALRARLERLPGVAAVSYVPGFRVSDWVDFPVRREGSAEEVMAVDNHVASGYFATLGVPFVAGSDFPAIASPRPRRMAIITQHLAKTLWPAEPAVGKTLIAGPADRPVEVEVTGVVRDAYFTGRMRLAGDMTPRFIFFSSAERPGRPGEATFYLRHQGPQDVVMPAVAKALREVDSRVAIARVGSLDSQIAADVAPLRILTTLLALFAGGSLLIAAIGQYAVVAFDGRRRRREFGVRIALGASPQQLITEVITESFRSTAIGLAIGFALSLGVAAALARVLYGITPTDPPTYFGVFVLLATASLLACYLPARRAARTDPVKALRME